MTIAEKDSQPQVSQPRRDLGHAPGVLEYSVLLSVGRRAHAALAFFPALPLLTIHQNPTAVP